MVLEKRGKAIFFIISIILILLIVQFAISESEGSSSVDSGSAAASSNFDEKKVETWKNDITKFENMQVDSINDQWKGANKEQKEGFLQKYAANNGKGPQDLKFDGINDENLKFSKTKEGEIKYGDGNANVYPKDLPASLKSLTYNGKDTLVGGNDAEFKLEFGDKSQVSVKGGERYCQLKGISI